MEVERTGLPEIGLRHEFVTAKGQHAAVVSHVSGRRDIVLYSSDDPDTVTATLSLNTDEASGVAELLGSARIVERLADLQRQVTGLKTVQVPIIAGSPYDGSTLGATQARTRTGASIVAVIRAGQILASPRPDFGFNPGDLVVVVGTEEGTAGLAVGAGLNDRIGPLAAAYVLVLAVLGPILARSPEPFNRWRARRRGDDPDPADPEPTTA